MIKCSSCNPAIDNYSISGTRIILDGRSLYKLPLLPIKANIDVDSLPNFMEIGFVSMTILKSGDYNIKVMSRLTYKVKHKIVLCTNYQGNNKNIPSDYVENNIPSLNLTLSIEKDTTLSIHIIPEEDVILKIKSYKFSIEKV